MEKSDSEYQRNVFPPFPPPPHGVAVVPFKEFKECGISLVRDEHGQEVDGVGVPTISLPFVDELDSCFERSQQGQQPNQENQKCDQKQWWQYWEEFDNKRPPLVVSTQQPRLGRIFNALSSFRGSRRWPFERKTKPGPKYFWDQFRVFIGASGYPPLWNRTDKEKPAPSVRSPSPEYSDDEVGIPPRQRSSVSVHISTKPEGKRLPGPVRPPYAYFNAIPIGIDSDEAVRALLELDKLRREEQLIDFLADPEKGVRIFLSSYSRDQSFLWSEDNLYTLPRLTRSFFKFIIKNNFFPERPDERRLQDALRIAELAYKELPFTSSISKFLPDDFGRACREYWGSRMADQSFWSSGESDVDGVDKSKNSIDDNSEASILSEVFRPPRSEITHISFDDEANDQDRLTGRCGEDDTNNLAPYPASIAPILQSVPESFKTLLSTTNPFPVGHRPGLVERSLRRIKRVLPPGGPPPGPADPHEGKNTSNHRHSIYTVEKDLDCMLAKIVLVPWVDSGLHGYTKPEMISPIEVERGGKEVQEVSEGSGDHDPLEDDINVLVSVASANLGVLADSIGMGLAGVWVQLRPDGEEERNPERSRYWYLDNLDAVVPSYWTR